MKKLLRIIFLTVPFILPEPTFAHAFGASYTLPLPSWIFLYGGTATVALSFLLISFFIGQQGGSGKAKPINISSNPIIRLFNNQKAAVIGKALGLITLIFSIAAGYLGTQDTVTNISPTLFWVVFLLGFTYFTAIFGDLWYIINPFRTILGVLKPLGLKKLERLPYPSKLSYIPALFFYYSLIYNELLSGGQSAIPGNLSTLMLIYTVVNVAFAIVFGPEAWFKYGEFFSVFFRLIGKVSPFHRENGQVYFRIPFSGLLRDVADSRWLILFIVFMLASTAFDGFRGTTIWFQWDLSVYDYYSSLGQLGYQLFHALVLAFAPLVFLAAYLLSITGMKLLTKNKLPVWELAKKFAFSLIPIALVYNIAHYYTLLVSQGQSIVALASDPFGQGWNLLGTAAFTPNPTLIRADVVWYSQVFFIVAGHIVAVLISHIIAIRTEKTPTKAILGQLPLLILMIAYTLTGLWILSQPYSFKG